MALWGEFSGRGRVGDKGLLACLMALLCGFCCLSCSLVMVVISLHTHMTPSWTLRARACGCTLEEGHRASGYGSTGSGSVPRLQKSIWLDFACQSSCLSSLSFKLCSCSLWHAPSFAHLPRSLTEDLDLKLLIFRVHHSAPSFDLSRISDPLNKIARNGDTFWGKKKNHRTLDT